MRIAITRVPGKERNDPDLCRKYGHSCYRVSPLTAKVYMDRVESFAAAVAQGAFDAIFFTSAITAQAIAPLLGTHPRVIAIGPQTAAVLEREGVHAEMLPSYYSRDLVPYLGTWIRGRRIGIPRADVPDDGLVQGIREAGGEAVETRCYALIPSRTPLPLAGADAVLFTSALSFREAVWEFREGLLLMAIGENTARAMREGGFPPCVTGDGSLAGSLGALNRYIHEIHEKNLQIPENGDR